MITFVKDKPGHDRRYAINCGRIKRELGWEQRFNFEKGLDITIRWYTDNKNWVDRVRSGKYKKWLEKNYKAR